MSNPVDSEQLRDMLDSYLHGKWNIGEYVHNIAMIDGLERRVKAYAEQYAYEYAKKIIGDKVKIDPQMLYVLQAERLAINDRLDEQHNRNDQLRGRRS